MFRCSGVSFGTGLRVAGVLACYDACACVRGRRVQQFSPRITTCLLLSLGCCLARHHEDAQSWFMTGKADSLFFLVLFKASVHGQVRLQKMAGDLMEPMLHSVWCLMLTAAISMRMQLLTY